MQPLGFHQLGSETACKSCLLSGVSAPQRKLYLRSRGRFLLFLPATKIICPRPVSSAGGKARGRHSLCFLFFSLQSKWVSKVSRDMTEREPQTWASLNFWQVWIQFRMQKFRLRSIFKTIHPQKALLILLHSSTRGLQECCSPCQPRRSKGGWIPACRAAGQVLFAIVCYKSVSV